MAISMRAMNSVALKDKVAVILLNNSDIRRRLVCKQWIIISMALKVVDTVSNNTEITRLWYKSNELLTNNFKCEAYFIQRCRKWLLLREQWIISGHEKWIFIEILRATGHPPTSGKNDHSYSTRPSTEKKEFPAKYRLGGSSRMLSNQRGWIFI